MKDIETFASPRPATASRRRVLQVLGTTVAVAALSDLGDGLRSPRVAAAAPAWQTPPAYDRIVGLL